jgi:hypothetical protein
VFSVVSGVLLRPLPFPDAARLVRGSEEHPGAVSPLRQATLSNLTFHAWSQASRTVEPLTAYCTMGVAAAAAATRLMQGVLFGITPRDTVSFVPALIVLLSLRCSRRCCPRGADGSCRGAPPRMTAAAACPGLSWSIRYFAVVIRNASRAV